MIIVVFERYVVVGCFCNVMFGCFGGVMFKCRFVWDYGGRSGIICIIEAIVRCDGVMWLLVVWVMLLVLYLDA